jgi:hypothetical protein
MTAHTGLVESGLCSHGSEDEAMCHIPAEGRPHDVWWFGFKCDTVHDYKPDGNRAHRGSQGSESGIYRSTDYVRDECRKLAMRLAEVAREDDEPLALPAPALTFTVAERVRA